MKKFDDRLSLRKNNNYYNPNTMCKNDTCGNPSTFFSSYCASCKKNRKKNKERAERRRQGLECACDMSGRRCQYCRGVRNYKFQGRSGELYLITASSLQQAQRYVRAYERSFQRV